jgi:hypothetical protein
MTLSLAPRSIPAAPLQVGPGTEKRPDLFGDRRVHAVAAPLGPTLVPASDGSIC